MWAILSDIHGNLEAFRAVLEDIDRQPTRVERIICLGDLVVYGPDPVECIDLTRRTCDLVLLGNWDRYALVGPSEKLDPHDQAPSGAWTREKLRRELGNDDPRWGFLAGLPRSHREAGVLFVHGSPRGPLHEWVFPEDVHNQRKMERNFALLDRGMLCFQGHTHFPGVFVEAVHEEEGDLNRFRETLAFFTLEQLDHVYEVDGIKAMVNVGSVGQPRDGDPRACYALYDGECVRFRRVPYDIETTVRKLRDDPPDNRASRLYEGR